MNYPFWDTGVGYGVLMAAIAVLHVFISHFAVGGGLYLVLAEHFARRRQDAEMLGYLEKLSRFFILLTLVTGAVTGVGIWFIIGLLNPTATEVLIHHFVWGWAIEWVFFFVEITAAILYYYGWRRMDAKPHLILGWIYFVAAYMSLVVINGIITFMLTPGDWVQNGNFWTGFFNPTYWPSLVMRTGITIMMAGLFTLLVASRFKGKRHLKNGLIRFNAAWGIIGLTVAALSFFFWYFGAILHELPPNILEKLTIPNIAHDRLLYSTGALGALLLVVLAFPRTARTPVTILILVVGFYWFGAFEWFRESVRKPWAINQYVYGNGLISPDVPGAPDYENEGLLSNMTFRTRNEGADLFRRACASCHTLRGYNGLEKSLAGTDQAYIKNLILGAEAIKGNMPPFLGTEEEADKIAEYLIGRFDDRPMEDITGKTGTELGELVYQKRCGTCHVPGGYQDLDGLYGDMDEDFLEMAGEMDDAMPPFTGTEKQAKALVEYFKAAAEATP